MTDAIVAEGHPTNILYAVVQDDITSDLMDRFETWLSSLGSQRTWVISSPTLIDYIDENPASGLSVHTYGCGLSTYSAHPPWSETLPKDVDLQHLQETEFLIKELVDFSKQSGCSFRLQLDRTPVGIIVNGKMDEGIRVGLLGEWRKAHGQ